MANENTAVAKKEDSALPAHLQQGKQVKFGNIDTSDLIIPRVKLIQSTSEEATAYDAAKVGEFWHTLAERSLGSSLDIIPISLKKEIVLWAPRGDDRGILARSTDCRSWDEGFANLKFEVKIKGVKETIVYDTKGSVAESRLAEFGTMIPGDPDSRPAASLTYRMMFLFPDHLDLGPAIIINTRSSIRPAKMLLSKIELRPVDHYYQRYTMATTDEKGDEGPYKGYSYRANGLVEDPEMAALAKSTYEKYGSLDWKANEEDDEAPSGEGAPSRSNVSEEDIKNAKF